MCNQRTIGDCHPLGTPAPPVHQCTGLWEGGPLSPGPAATACAHYFTTSVLLFELGVLDKARLCLAAAAAPGCFHAVCVCCICALCFLHGHVNCARLVTSPLRPLTPGPFGALPVLPS